VYKGFFAHLARILPHTVCSVTDIRDLGDYLD